MTCAAFVPVVRGARGTMLALVQVQADRLVIRASSTVRVRCVVAAARNGVGDCEAGAGAGGGTVSADDNPRRVYVLWRCRSSRRL